MGKPKPADHGKSLHERLAALEDAGTRGDRGPDVNRELDEIRGDMRHMAGIVTQIQGDLVRLQAALGGKPEDKK